jgi:hypothetical protein
MMSDEKNCGDLWSIRKIKKVLSSIIQHHHKKESMSSDELFLIYSRCISFILLRERGVILVIIF